MSGDSDHGHRRVAAIFSSELAQVPMAELLDARELLMKPSDTDAVSIDVVAGWRDDDRAAGYARLHGIRYVRVDSGLLPILASDGPRLLSLRLGDTASAQESGWRVLEDQTRVGESELLERADSALSRLAALDGRIAGNEAAEFKAAIASKLAAPASPRRPLNQLFAAGCILSARYIDPDQNRPCSLERVLDYLELQRELHARNRGRIFCFGFHPWKRHYVRAYLRAPGNTVLFPRSARHAKRLGFDASCRALVWGQRETVDVRALCERSGVVLWRMEDGFLRSVGLGSDLAAPASLVIDKRGIYYDPSQPSDLEHILQTTEFGSDELARARRLRERIIESKLSKYNVGRAKTVAVPSGRRIVLAPGQVEDDASIRLGCSDVRTNLGLLERARKHSPEAYLIFKPHPDVLSGNRAGAVDPEAALAICDHIESEATLPDCLAIADEVHTLTSLVGFESLLRGLDVFVYGRPFYGSWGLTVDHNPLPRRTRTLTLDELVAGTLLRYPRYINRKTGRFSTPEDVLLQLEHERATDDGKIGVSWSTKQWRRLSLVYKEVTHAS